VFEILREHKLYAKESKFELFRNFIKLLGQQVSGNSTSPTAEKLPPSKFAPVLTNRRDLQRFLQEPIGLFLPTLRVLKRFVDHYAFISAPLPDLIQNEPGFEWTSAAQTTFNQLKAAITTLTIGSPLHSFRASS